MRQAAQLLSPADTPPVCMLSISWWEASPDHDGLNTAGLSRFVTCIYLLPGTEYEPISSPLVLVPFFLTSTLPSFSAALLSNKIEWKKGVYYHYIFGFSSFGIVVRLVQQGKSLDWIQA